MSNAEQRNCPQCGAPMEGAVSSCKYCGAEVAAPVAAQPQYAPPQAPPQYVQPPVAQYAPPPVYTAPVNPSGKSKVVAGILGILLGGLGIHKFYLGKTGMGVLYLLFFWTYIPALIGLIEGIIYLCATDEVFYEKYVVKK